LLQKKAHPPDKRMGFNTSHAIGWATPLPIITGPEALRPTLSRSLPFSQRYFYLMIYRHKTENPLAFISPLSALILKFDDVFFYIVSPPASGFAQRATTRQVA
jgi:hypothetical protein